MTLAQILVIAAVAAIYGLVGKWLIAKMVEEERRNERDQKRTTLIVNNS